MSKQLALPGALPRLKNPFPEDSYRHEIWNRTSLDMERKWHVLNVRMLREAKTISSLEEHRSWQLELICRRFDMVAQRNLVVVHSDDEMRFFDKGLRAMAKATLKEWSKTKFRVCPIKRIALSLTDRMEVWSATARNYRLQQESLRAESLVSGTPPITTSPQRDRPLPLANQRETNATPRAEVDNFLDRVHNDTGSRVKRSDIWSIAGYTEATEFERFQKDKGSVGSNAKIRRVLNLSTEQFVERLNRLREKQAK